MQHDSIREYGTCCMGYPCVPLSTTSQSGRERIGEKNAENDEISGKKTRRSWFVYGGGSCSGNWADRCADQDRKDSYLRHGCTYIPVSYTHLTLPTIYSV